MIDDASEDCYLGAHQQKLIHIGTHLKKNKITRFETEITTYQSLTCEDCPLRSQCTRAKEGKKIQVSKELIRLRENSLENIKSDLGSCLRMNRSIQSEGTFGVVTEDYHFRRCLTRGNPQILTELLLLAMAFDLQKLHTKIQSGRCGQHLFKHQIA